MTISATLQNYLHDRDVDYMVVHHAPTFNSMSTAQAAHVPGDRLAKAVMLEDDQGFVMAVIPSTAHVSLDAVRVTTGRGLELSTEHKLTKLFRDCLPGAIPPVGPAFGVNALVDDGLLGQPDVWFEAGDHEDLVRISGDSFRGLMAGAQHAPITQHI
jgi:Ala-tRNA(Pro) deacylase